MGDFCYTSISNPLIGKNMNQLVILRQTADELGSRYLQATLAPNGDVAIEGQDLGKGVEGFWGEGLTEYEFAMTIQAVNVPALLAALGAQSNVLSALQEQFESQSDMAAKTFLDAHNIPYEFWSRIGD
jgi:hypothetical protein